MFGLSIEGLDIVQITSLFHPLDRTTDQLKSFFIANWNVTENTINRANQVLNLWFSLDLKNEYINQYVTNPMDRASFSLRRPFPLATIKERRNLLAHWWEYFSDTTTDWAQITIEEIEELMNSAIIYISKFKEMTNDFIRSKWWRAIPIPLELLALPYKVI